MSSNNINLIQEDEIDLRELFGTIYKNKMKIALTTFLITAFSVAYALYLPNSYVSSTNLTLQTQSKPSMGGLGALASMAGVDIGSGSGSGLDPAISMEAIIKDYAFEEYMIKKYNLVEKLKVNRQNLVFALGYEGIYDLVWSNIPVKILKDEEEAIYLTYKKIIDMISVVSDKKSSIITLSIENYDRFLAKELVEIYLKETTAHLRKIEMQDVQKQIDYYKNELNNAVELSLKEQLSGLISGLVQKKVLSLASEYYNVTQFTKPQVPYIRDKSKPKRALIVVVAFVTSIILGVFMVFFKEFLKRDKDEQQPASA